MRFDQLTPGQLARVPRMHARRGEQPPPIVVIESQLKKCGLGDCLDWEVTARDPETGREHVYHRPPGFVTATPALVKFMTFETFIGSQVLKEFQ